MPAVDREWKGQGRKEMGGRRTRERERERGERGKGGREGEGERERGGGGGGGRGIGIEVGKTKMISNDKTTEPSFSFLH